MKLDRGQSRERCLYCNRDIGALVLRLWCRSLHLSLFFSKLDPSGDLIQNETLPSFYEMCALQRGWLAIAGIRVSDSIDSGKINSHFQYTQLTDSELKGETNPTD